MKPANKPLKTLNLVRDRVRSLGVRSQIQTGQMHGPGNPSRLSGPGGSSSCALG